MHGSCLPHASNAGILIGTGNHERLMDVGSQLLHHAGPIVGAELLLYSKLACCMSARHVVRPAECMPEMQDC